MKKLFYKEMKLSANPLTYWFIAFSAMTMIPSYPILFYLSWHFSYLPADSGI